MKLLFHKLTYYIHSNIFLMHELQKHQVILPKHHRAQPIDHTNFACIKYNENAEQCFKPKSLNNLK